MRGPLTINGRAISLYFLAFAIGIARSAFSSAENTGPSLIPPGRRPAASARQDTLADLKSRGYFKSTNCQEVANTFLTAYGLPRIGATNAARSTGPYLKFNRAHEHESPPKFMDQVYFNTNMHIKIIAEEQWNPQRWAIRIERQRVSNSIAGAKLHYPKAETLILFQQKEKGGKKICEQETIVYTYNPSRLVGRRRQPQVISLNDCLDLFILKSEGNVRASIKLDQALEWLEKDCMLAIHYSGEATRRIGH